MGLHMSGDIDAVVSSMKPAEDLKYKSNAEVALQRVKDDVAAALDRPGAALEDMTVVVTSLTNDGKFSYESHRLAESSTEDEPNQITHFKSTLSTEGGQSDALYYAMSATSELMYNAEEQEPGAIFSGSYGDINVGIYIEVDGDTGTK